jgi:hypothetical protein
METRANYAIVGFFTLVVMLSAFGFVYWMAKFGNTGETAPLIVRIPGSANGLSNGSPVRFNGIPYGVIRNISIDPDSPDFVIAETTIRADAPVYTDTRAALEIQGLTGSAYIELQGGSPGNPNILTRARELGQVAVIDADPSGVTNLLATADDILNRANRVIGEVEGFVKDARSPLTETLKNTEVFTAALRDNADGIDDFLQSVADLSQTVKSVSGRYRQHACLGRKPDHLDRSAEDRQDPGQCRQGDLGCGQRVGRHHQDAGKLQPGRWLARTAGRGCGGIARQGRQDHCQRRSGQGRRGRWTTSRLPAPMPARRLPMPVALSKPSVPARKTTTSSSPM